MRRNNFLLSLFLLMAAVVLSACTNNAGEVSVENDDDGKTANGETPPENERGWKDSFSVVPDETVKIAIQFKNKGVYMFHCYILEHEDNGMMGQVKVE